MRVKHITLNDIAERLNVSKVTVSKALRGHPDISLETTKLIKKVAEELGYYPNFMARNLSSRKSNTIGLVIPKIAHFFFSSLIEHIYNYAFENNYEIILTVSQENAAREQKHIETLISMRVDGIIISITQETNDLDIFHLIKSRKIPIVFVDRIPGLTDVNTVTIDDAGGSYKAIEHAVTLGYKKIGHFAGNTKINIGRERLLGFQNAMDHFNLPVDPSWIVAGGYNENSGYDAFMKLYRQKNLPELILAVTYPVAIGIYMAAEELGLKIPDDIDVICFGNASIQNYLSPPLSCINQPTDQLAVNAMRVLIDNIERKEEIVPQHIVVDTNLILRGTCIKYNGSKSIPTLVSI